MKTAIYIEDGLVQLVITPESDFEKNAMKSFQGDIDTKVFQGSFYDCRGGWVRQTAFSSVHGMYDGSGSCDDKSLIITNRTSTEKVGDE